MVYNGFGKSVLDHLKRHVRRRVVCSGWHSVRSLLGEFGGDQQILEQVAQNFWVNGLVAALRRVFGSRPSVFTEDSEQTFGPLVQPLVKQESQYLIVVVAIRFTIRKGFVKHILREFAFLFEYPCEYGPDKVPENGFAVYKPSLRIAGRLALLLKRPSGGHSLVELFADAFGGYGIRDSMGLRGSALVEVSVNGLNCLQRHGAGSVGIEFGGHSGVPLVMHRQPNRAVIAEFVRLYHQSNRHLQVHVLCERTRGYRHILPI